MWSASPAQPGSLASRFSGCFGFANGCCSGLHKQHSHEISLKVHTASETNSLHGWAASDRSPEMLRTFGGRLLAGLQRKTNPPAPDGPAASPVDPWGLMNLAPFFR